MGKRKQLEDAQGLGEQGDELYRQGQPLAAIEKWEAAKAIYQELGIQEGVAVIEKRIGLTLRSRGLRRQEEALRHLEIAKDIYEKLEMPERKRKRSIANLEQLIGILRKALCEYTKAIKHYDAAKTLYESLKMPEKVAELEWLIGNALLDSGEHEEALKRFDSAKSIYFRKFASEVAGMDYCGGMALCKMGKHCEALKRFDDAKKTFENLNDELHIARVEHEIGITLFERARLGSLCFDSALEHLNLALATFQKLQRFEEACNVENAIGNILSVQGKHDEALPKYYAVLRLWEYLDSPKNQAIALRNIGGSKMKLGYYKEASQDLNRAFELMEWVRIGVKSPELRRSIRKQYLMVSDALFVNNLARWAKSQFQKWSYLNEALNNLELAKSSSVAETIELGGGSAPCPEVEKLTILEGELLNKWEENYHKRAENRRLEMEDQIGESEFDKTVEDLDEEYKKIQRKVDRLRSKVLVKCADFGITSIPRTYNILERTLKVFSSDERWCILEFGISDVIEKLYVFLVTAIPNIDGTPGVFCEINRHDLNQIKKLSNRCREVIKTLRQQKGEDKWIEANKELKALSKQLYDTLIPEKIGELLKNLTKSTAIEHLIIVPHKFLHYVPFEILHDGDEYLGIKYAISTNFSLDLARLCVKKREHAMKGQPFFLIVKNPLNDIGGADQSAECLVSLLKSKRARTKNIKFKELKHKDATQAAFTTSANENSFDVLHYAGHGVYMGKYPDQSSLFLHTEEKTCTACKGKKKHGKWDLLNANEFIHKIKFKSTPIVFLLGCETGIVKVEPGDEMFGLARALMYAGATSLILSRWIVRGKIAPLFTKEFYQQLLNGASVAVALWNARCKIYTPEAPNFTDWAAFFLSGDPFRRIA